ncbi:MAG: hypothetical protein B7X99_00765 [Rhizobiales bacterium 17-65-6]|nr:MAG: hypothetical protein B7Y84_00075 [Azorhizobium sp. 32-67-21]OZA01414.1 MAG: hypothetical protein B7X99_00765 [Rhizobiales bacterium 17-65-6]
MLFRTIHDVALMLDRERVGREASPSAGVSFRQPRTSSSGRRVRRRNSTTTASSAKVRTVLRGSR